MSRRAPVHSRAQSSRNSIRRNNRRDARAAGRCSPVGRLPVLHVDDASHSKLTPLPDAGQQVRWKELQNEKTYKNSDHASSCSPQKSAGYSRVGLLAWRSQVICTPLYLPQPLAKWYKAAILTYSGGTAPALHRTSLLCPDGHPRQISLYHNEIVAMSRSRRLENRPASKSPTRLMR
jgi:hypothetical protein